ncbi:MAG: DUF4129 domain-containing protein [Planctomycetota bacterium]
MALPQHTWPAFFLLASVCSPALCVDIRGPLGPVGPPHQEGPLTRRRVYAGVVAAGFAAVALGFYLRRRRRRAGEEAGGKPSQKATPSPPEGETASPADGAADDLYAELMDRLRAALDMDGAAAGASLTPRELAERAPHDLEAGVRDRWRAVCRRAERVLYAGEEVTGDQRRRDAEFVLETARRLAGGDGPEGSDGS